jgi:hypothetical protein
VAKTEQALNDRPRKRLNFQTPSEVLEKERYASDLRHPAVEVGFFITTGRWRLAHRETSILYLMQ